MTCGNTRTHLETAEDAVRQALIISLKNKKDDHLSDLYSLLGSIQDLIYQFPTTSDTITFGTDGNYPSLYRNGSDMDNMDFSLPDAMGPYNVPSGGDTVITGAEGSDTISLGDYKSQEYRPD